MSEPLILCVDDDADVVALLEVWLMRAGYRIITASGPKKVQEVLGENIPQMILLDVMMPEMNGYAFCAQLKKDAHFSNIPVVFVTALDQAQDKARAMAAGGVDFLSKPIEQGAVLRTVKKHMRPLTEENISVQNQKKEEKESQPDSKEFAGFKLWLSQAWSLSDMALSQWNEASIKDFYGVFPSEENHMARAIADFENLPFLQYIEGDKIRLGDIPSLLCKKYHIVPILTESGAPAFAISHPFDVEAIAVLKESIPAGEKLRLLVSPPWEIEKILGTETTP